MFQLFPIPKKAFIVRGVLKSSSELSYRSLAYISGGARDYEALVSPSVVEAVQQQENDMTRYR